MTPDTLAASGRMIVLGALLAGVALGLRTQTLWLTAPLLALVLVDRIGRGVAGAIVGAAMTFTIGAPGVGRAAARGERRAAGLSQRAGHARLARTSPAARCSI